jgi:hypothetical protein
MDPTTLYLVSAEKRGIRYWKVGITHHENPLKRDPSNYREVFRAERLEWGGSAEEVELCIAQTFKWIMMQTKMEGLPLSEVPAREGLSYDFPVEVPLEVYDWWLTTFQNSDSAPNPDYNPEWGNAATLKSIRYPDGKETKFLFCQNAINHSPGLFDFQTLSKNYMEADLETLRKAFGKYYYLDSSAGKPFSEDKDLNELRNHAQHYYALAEEFIPQLQHICSFRTMKKPRPTKPLKPMW